ncbi:MAG TPA: PAS domain S-box protein [Smithellaceae bacterium]|nr:PAS domain S-box protein [Smithellaceae bacterium]
MKKKSPSRKQPFAKIEDHSFRRILEESAKQIQRSEEKYRRIFENIQDVYYEIDMEGTILEISPSIEKYSSFKRENLLGKSIYDFYADKQDRFAFLQTIHEKGYVRDFEIRLQDQQGIVKTCSITAAILAGDKEVPQLIAGSMRDISERKMEEEILKQREEELSVQSKNLMEVNTALKVLLKQREEDRKEIEENILINIHSCILPELEKLKEGPLTNHQKKALEMIHMQLHAVVSPFRNRLSQTAFSLTPQEMQVADLVKNGLATKEIACFLGISIKTVNFHRDNLRKKLGINNRRANLRSLLLKLAS